ncbi:MAG: histone deacetylase family protein [Alphaproteobacteria bacterium]|nr:histone deacetylase family protein [Alphaproteobacteria bacterium]
MRVPVFFHPAQLAFAPELEWFGGEAIAHPETALRAESIVEALREDGSFALRAPERVPDAAIRALHAPALLALYDTAAALPAGEACYPAVFARDAVTAPDPSRLANAGAFAFDTATPLARETRDAVRWSAACAHEAALAVRSGAPLAYALSRPPGHHAGRASFGGYCYVNNAALAVRALKRGRRVAVLDIDVHHGNGTQALFWRDPRVLVVSVHEHPDTCFPFFAGHPSEIGGGAGRGANLNVTEGAGCDGRRYAELLDRHALPALRAFRPDVLVLSAGLDTYRLDPVGRFALDTGDLADVGERIGGLGVPVVAVQEGGYHTPDLGINAIALLDGIRRGLTRAGLAAE